MAEKLFDLGSAEEPIELLSDAELNELLALDSDEQLEMALCGDWSFKNKGKTQSYEDEILAGVVIDDDEDLLANYY